jgi:hypothetical protein
MNNPEEKIPARKKLVAFLAKALPPSWRFPVCGLSASVCGLEAAQPLRVTLNPDPILVRAMAEFLGPSDLSPLALVQAHVVEVPDGIAWRRGAHLTADGRLIDPLSVGMNLSMDRWLVKRQRFFPRVRRIPGTVISLATDGHNNFYHWMLDLLPKLFLVLAAGLKDEYLYIGASTRFQQECLKLLGVPARRLLDCNDIPFLQAERLVVPFLGERHPPNVFSAAKCRLLVEAFSSRIDRGNSFPELPVRFLVSRSKTRSRRVVNEGELLARLEPLGFRTVYLEDRSFLEQLTLFARAEAIVASTGAGLINLLYSRPGTPVAILMPEECPDLVCRDIAAFAQLRCEIFYAERHPPGTSDKIGCDMVLEEPLLTRLAAFLT